MIPPTSWCLQDHFTSMLDLPFPMGPDRAQVLSLRPTPLHRIDLQTGGEPPGGVRDGVGVQIWVFGGRFRVEKRIFSRAPEKSVLLCSSFVYTPLSSLLHKVKIFWSKIFFLRTKCSPDWTSWFQGKNQCFLLNHENKNLGASMHYALKSWSCSQGSKAQKQLFSWFGWNHWFLL